MVLLSLRIVDNNLGPHILVPDSAIFMTDDVVNARLIEFHSCFINGSVDRHHVYVFFTDVETGKWIEQGLGYTELAEKIGERLDELFPTEDKTTRKLEWVCEERGNHLFNFGYCHYVLSTFEVFEIYTSDRRYLCNLLLMNTNSWLVLHLNDEPDLRGFQSLVIEIPAILEKLVRM